MNSNNQSEPSQHQLQRAGYVTLHQCPRQPKLDGTKFLLENDNWALLRFSGTEPLLRLFAEADSAEKAKELIKSLKALVSS